MGMDMESKLGIFIMGEGRESWVFWLYVSFWFFVLFAFDDFFSSSSALAFLSSFLTLDILLLPDGVMVMS